MRSQLNPTSCNRIHKIDQLVKFFCKKKYKEILNITPSNSSTPISYNLNFNLYIGLYFCTTNLILNFDYMDNANEELMGERESYLCY